MNHIIYIATDRTPAQKLEVYGGYNICPALSLMAEHGTLYKDAVAAAGSTIMCHASEWLGVYTFDHKDHLPKKKVSYDADYKYDESIFSDMIKMGYESHLIFVERPNKYYETYTQAAKIWPKDAKIHLLKDWDQKGATPGSDRITHLMEIHKVINDCDKRGVKAFIWLKIHGFYTGKQFTHYTEYEGQFRPTSNDTFIAENDAALMNLLKEFGYPNESCPEIWFASDHGSFVGEWGKHSYGFHLEQEIVHVPIICSKRILNQEVVKEPFSMKEVRFLLTRENKIKLRGPTFKEKYLYAETLYPGQFPAGPNKGKASLAKIMVRRGKYKYVYSPFGSDGLQPKASETLYDLSYDPHEKINIAIGFLDYIEPVKAADGKETFAKHVSRIVDKNHEAGWENLKVVLEELREEAFKIWSRTGRGKYFNPPRLK